MPDTIYGLGSTIANLPAPAAAVNIASSTNAAPTVITTSAAHGLQTGFIVIINGHATNTNANGIRVVTVLTSTTFKISTIAGFPGTFVNGNGVGGATGTVQSLFLAGFNVPADTTDPMDASTVNVGFEALADMTAFLAYSMWANAQILKGGSWTLKNGADGTIELGGTMTNNGTFNVVTNGIIAALLQVDGATAQFINGAKFYNWGKESYPDPQRLTDADQTISANDGQIVILATPTAARTITMEQATDPPIEGQYIQFYLSQPGTVGNYYEIKREGSANYIVRIDGYDGGGNAMQGMVRIHVESGVWRLSGGIGLHGIGTDA